MWEVNLRNEIPIDLALKEIVNALEMQNHIVTKSACGRLKFKNKI